jgi:nickel-dependent lactate racemase
MQQDDNPGNHCAKFIASPKARTGILDGNPIHEDMAAAARMANLRYIVNVIIDESKHAAAAFAGDPILKHMRSGCDYLMKLCVCMHRRDLQISLSRQTAAIRWTRTSTRR